MKMHLKYRLRNDSHSVQGKWIKDVSIKTIQQVKRLILEAKINKLCMLHGFVVLFSVDNSHITLKKTHPVLYYNAIK